MGQGRYEGPLSHHHFNENPQKTVKSASSAIIRDSEFLLKSRELVWIIAACRDTCVGVASLTANIDAANSVT